MKQFILSITLILAVGLPISRASGVDAKYKTPQTQNVAALTTDMSVTQNGNSLVFNMPDGPDFVQIYAGSTLVWEGNADNGQTIAINSTSWPAGFYKADPRHGKIYDFSIEW